MKEAYKYIVNDLNLKSGDTVVAAISGGPDSMALLKLLIDVKQVLNIKIVCAHVNHNTGRKGQLEEQKYVCEFCSKNNIIFEMMIIEDYSDDNFENEARTKRYNYFEELVKKYQALYLFTAHHGDDLIETVLMRIVRGSTLKGYSGFSKIVDRKQYKIVRPLIGVTKQDIVEFNKVNNIKYYVDKTNLDDDHTRNRYRKYILPLLKKEDPKVHQKFYKYSKTLLEYNNYFDKIVEKKIKVLYINNALNISLFLKEDKIIRMKIIYSILEHIYQNDLMLITDKHASIVYETIISNKANVCAYLPNNIKATKSYQTLVFETANQENNEYMIELIEDVNLPNGKSIEFLKEANINTNFICRLNSKDVALPLYVRTRKDGDKISVKGMIGRKKINDIFIDCKISMKERLMWPVVVDSNENIVWLPGLKKTKFDKTKEEKCDIILRYY